MRSSRSIILMACSLIMAVSTAMAQQRIDISEERREVNHIVREGFVCRLSIEEAEVQKNWEKELKQYGKVHGNRHGEVWLEEGEMPTVSPTPVNLLSTVKVVNGQVEIFCAYSNPEGVEEEDVSQRLRQFLYDFAVETYRLDLQEQIAAADGAVEDAVKNHEDKVDDGEHLRSDLQKNEEERKELEQELLENMRNHERLEAELQKNQSEQAAALEEIDRLRAISSAKREKLKAIQ